MPIMERMIQPGSVVHTDCPASHNALDVSDFHHVRINHSELFADRRFNCGSPKQLLSQLRRWIKIVNQE